MESLHEEDGIDVITKREVTFEMELVPAYCA